MIAEMALLGLFPAAMVFAALSDLFTMTISNRLSALLAGCFFLVALAIGMPLVEIGWHVLAALVVLAVAFACFAFGWIGGGDAKLAAATALWFGFSHLPDYLLLASILGGVLTLLILWVRQYPLPMMLARQEWAARLHDLHAGIPYGVALAISGLIVYSQSDFIAQFATSH
jgi:prepilin peptidase CpaA